MSGTRKLFNDDGSVTAGVIFGDPYRRAENLSGVVIANMFDEEGYPIQELMAEVHRVIATAKATSSAAQVYHASCFGSNTKGSYPPIYYWR